ncbi:MAG: o-succinylbenzoate synthase [Actinomycetota bacterium]|nr:o-succinylbenzoate synthase [Actinomycetota bacterium]
MTALGSLLQGAVPFAVRLHREFRGVTVREGMLIQGPSGWGEFSPFEDYDDQAASRWLGAAIESAFGTWPQAQRSTINVNAIIPAVSPAVARELAEQAVVRDGCTTIKVKITGEDTSDEARVAAIREALDATLGYGVGLIRIDANACWNAPQAISSLHRLAAYGLEYVEQPVPSKEELRTVRAAVDVPIAVDESIRSDRGIDPRALSELAEIADVAIIKPSPVGGVRRALEIAELVKLPVVVSSSMDSSIGLCAALALAAALDVDRACGLGTGALLATDLVVNPLVPVGGVMRVQRLSPDAGSLQAAQQLLVPERVQFWHERVGRAWEAGASEAWQKVITSSA